MSFHQAESDERPTKKMKLTSVADDNQSNTRMMQNTSWALKATQYYNWKPNWPLKLKYTFVSYRNLIPIAVNLISYYICFLLYSLVEQ